MNEVIRQRRLPLRKAVEIALRNLRIRWTRSILVTLGIVLAIAFLVFIIFTESFMIYVPDRGSPELFDRLRMQGILTGTDDTDARIQTFWMAGIALTIAFVGILNAMVMSVTERTREIGTMKCLGALDSFIVKLYLMESLFQGALGTVIGIIAGVCLAYFDGYGVYGSEIWGLIPVAGIFRLMLIAFVLGIFLTLAGALYPTIKAARMQPVEAMSTEV